MTTPDEPQEPVMLPRLGGHLRVWGSGHTCSQDTNEPGHQCVCECGIPAPYNTP
jgi:hypothetical protein